MSSRSASWLRTSIANVAEGLRREPYVGEGGPFLAQALCLYR
jgi:hypothetical protein